MPDKFPKHIRSKIMSKIHGKDTSPELLLRKELYKRGYRYRLRKHFKELNFKPDIVFVKEKLCVFIDGCFWHGCPKCSRRPQSNKTYWNRKLEENVIRDKNQVRYLKKEGWKAIRVWEHDINKNISRVADKISNCF